MTATLHPTQGGWVAYRSDGALDASGEQALEALLTVVSRGEEARGYGWQLGHAALRLPGLVPRAVAGEWLEPW